MLHVHRILAATDLTTASDAAVAHAGALADRFSAELHLVHVTTHPLVETAAYPAADLEALLAQQLQRLGIADRAQVYPLLVRADTVAHGVLSHAALADIDLIVTGTAGRVGLEALRFGSVARDVVREAHCPVLTIRDTDAMAPMPIRRILVPIDFSDCSQHALVHAKAMAALFDARLMLLHVMHLRTHLVRPAALNTLTLAETSPSFYQDQLAQLCRSVPGPQVKVSYHVAAGRATDQILHHATTLPCDLVMISTHGMTGIRHFFLGSVTEQVVKQAPCPVFTVKAFARSLVPYSPAQFRQPNFTRTTLPRPVAPLATTPEVDVTPVLPTRGAQQPPSALTERYHNSTHFHI